MKPPYGFYENGFGYIRLENLGLGGLPETIGFEGRELVRKEEFHLSLVWAGRLGEMIDKSRKKKIEAEIIEEFEKFTEEYPLDNYILTKELRVVRTGEQKTLIAMAEVANIDTFFENLSRKYDVNLPVQPTHITLYTLPSDKVGIGILSYGELQAWSEPVDIIQLQKLF